MLMDGGGRIPMTKIWHRLAMALLAIIMIIPAAILYPAATVGAADTDNTLPAPTLVWPPNGAYLNNTNVNLTWSWSQSAVYGKRYEVQWTSQSNFDTPLTDWPNWDSVLISAYLPERTWRWRVRAIVVDEHSWVIAYTPWSPTYIFTIDETPPAVPSLVSPADGGSTTDTTPTLDWSDASGASSYEWQISHYAGLSPLFSSGTTTASSYTFPAAIIGDFYYWRVRAKDAAGNYSGWSPVRQFNVLPIATTLTIPRVVGEYGSIVTLTATLKTTGSGIPVTGKTIHFTLDGANRGVADTDANGVATKTAGLITILPGSYTIGVRVLFAGDETYASSLGSSSLRVLKIPTTLTVTEVVAAYGSTANLTATLSKTSESSTVAGKTIFFNVNGANVGSAITDAGGVAVLAGVSLSGNPTGIFPTGINAQFMGDAYLEPSYGSAPLTINVGSGGWSPASGQGATGGGWYTLTDRGRVNFSFNINAVPHPESAKYKGELLLINDGRWRLKGEISYYKYLGNSQSEAAGLGQLYLWDPTYQDNQGGWVLFSDQVGFGIVFGDSGTGKTKDPLNLDKFGINISIDIPEGAPPLPSSSPAQLVGGNIDIKDINHNGK